MLIGALMVAAAALLISAFLTGTTALAGAALVISLVAAVLYVLILRRAPATGDEPAGSRDREAATDVEAPDGQEPAEVIESEPAKSEPAKSEPAKSEPAKSEPAKSEPAKAEPAKAGPDEPQPAPTRPAEPGIAGAAEPGLDGATVVHIVPGRMRYHVDGCRVLDGQEAEALTVDDARDEGFTACSRCAVHGRSPATA